MRVLTTDAITDYFGPNPGISLSKKSELLMSRLIPVVAAGVSVSVSGVEITGGHTGNAEYGGGGILYRGALDAGPLDGDQRLTLTNCELDHNFARRSVGGLSVNFGHLVVSECEIFDNTTQNSDPLDQHDRIAFYK